MRDSDLPATSKLVAFVLSTYMDANGRAWPSKLTIAAGAGLSRRAVDPAVARLEAAGLLEVEHSRSRRGNRYRAAGARLEGDGTAHLTTVTAHLTTGTAHEVPPKAVERDKRVTSFPRKKETGRVPTARPELEYLDTGAIGG